MVKDSAAPSRMETAARHSADNPKIATSESKLFY
jgi:hypothetical protein